MNDREKKIRQSACLVILIVLVMGAILLVNLRKPNYSHSQGWLLATSPVMQEQAYPLQTSPSDELESHPPIENLNWIAILGGSLPLFVLVVLLVDTWRKKPD